jgi:hypothetical protein
MNQSTTDDDLFGVERDFGRGLDLSGGTELQRVDALRVAFATLQP